MSDNIGSINRLQTWTKYTVVYPSATLSPDWDVTEQIHNTIHKIGAQVLYKWVQGHKDRRRRTQGRGSVQHPSPQASQHHLHAWTRQAPIDISKPTSGTMMHLSRFINFRTYTDLLNCNSADTTLVFAWCTFVQQYRASFKTRQIWLCSEIY